MAYQTPKPCELCEADASIKFKCVDCDKYMCEQCKKVHTRVPTLTNHQVVEVKSTEDIHLLRPSIQVDCIPCEYHARKFHCLFCKSCDALVCSDCVSGSHTKHDFEPIGNACERKLSEIKLFDFQIKNEMTNLRQTTNNLQQTKREWEDKVAEAKTLVNKNEAEIKDMVANHAAKLREAIEKISRSRDDSFANEGVKTDEKMSSLTRHQATVKAALESNQGIKIFDTSAELHKFSSVLDIPVSPLPIVTIDILPPKLSKKTVNEIFGRLSHISTPSVLNFELVNRFSSNISCVDKMMISEDGCWWISAFDYGKDSSYLFKGKISGSAINKVQKINVDVFDMAVTMDGSILISVHMTSDVKRVTKSGNVETFINVSPFLARGIHVTSENEILVGVRDNGEQYLMAENSCRKIVVFGSDGKEKQSYEFDDNNKRLLTIPRRITTNLNGDIVVIDSIAKEAGRMFAIGRRGDKKWTYEQSDCFDPDDMVSTSTGFIVVNDERNHTLYVFSVIGSLLVAKNLKEWGIYFPRSVAVSNDELLWIGCATHIPKEDAKKKHKDFASLSCVRMIY